MYNGRENILGASTC